MAWQPVGSTYSCRAPAGTSVQSRQKKRACGHLPGSSEQELRTELPAQCYAVGFWNRVAQEKKELPRGLQTPVPTKAKPVTPTFVRDSCSAGRQRHQWRRKDIKLGVRGSQLTPLATHLPCDLEHVAKLSCASLPVKWGSEFVLLTCTHNKD